MSSKWLRRNHEYMKSGRRSKMLTWKDGELKVIDGEEEINTLCDLFKVPEDVRAGMIREEKKRQAEKLSEGL